MASIDKTALEKFVRNNPAMTYREIAKEFNCSHQAVHELCMRLGLRQKTRPRVSLSNDALCAYMTANIEKSYKEVAAHFGVNASLVSHRARALNIPRLPQAKVDVLKLKGLLKKNPGARVVDIAEDMGFTPGTISQALIRLGLREPQRRIIDDKKFAEVLAENPSAGRKELAEKFGCFVAAVAKAKRRINAPKKDDSRKEPKRLTWDEVEVVLKENPEISVVDLAKKLDIGVSTLGRMLRKHKMLRGHKQKIDKDEMTKMFRDGKSSEEIANRFGVTKSAIWNAVASMGLKVRDLRK